MDSSGNYIKKVIQKNEIFGLFESLKGVNWSNTVLSERDSEILFVSSKLYKEKIFSSKNIKKISIPLIKMSEETPLINI